jgi:hypothetical protein
LNPAAVDIAEAHVEKDGRVCCITMIKAEALAGMVKGLLGPMMKELIAS